NENSIELVRTAANRLGFSWENAAAEERTVGGKVANLWMSSGRTVDDLRQIASNVDMPPAVVRVLLQRQNLLPAGYMTGASQLVTSIPRSNPPGSGTARRTPDFSFQEVAIARARDALHRGPGRRVAVVAPTGAGKTEIGIRTALEELHQS